MSNQEVTQADKARLLLNSPNLANRWVEFGNEKLPILHLSIGELEQFRAYCAPIEETYLKFADSELPLTDFLVLYRDQIIEIFQHSVPEAASIALHMPTTKIVATARPLEAFHAVLAQWVHNLEIGRLHEAFPAPQSDSDEESTLDQGNPLSTVQKLMSAYHCSFEDALNRTTPQIYLMGVDAAWSYESIRADKSKKRSIPNLKKDGKLDGNAYAQYLQGIQGGFAGVDATPRVGK